MSRRRRREAGEGTARARQEAIESIEELRRRDLVIKVRAHRWARRIANGVFWSVVATVVIGAAAIAFREPFGEGWVGVALGLAVFMFILLETLGVLGHLRAMRGAIDTWLQGRLYAWLSAGQEPQALGDHRDPDSES